MKIAVIDDERHSREELVHQILQHDPHATVCQAASGVSALELLQEEQGFDVIFLDIRLGDMMGTTIAALARKLDPNTRIVFASAFPEYGVTAFELGVDNYILKPFDPQRVAQVLALCDQSLQQQEDTTVPLRKIAVTVNRHTTLLDVQDILYIETSGAGRQCILHTRDKEFSAGLSLGEYEARLRPMGFFRIHKTCLVQLRLICDIFPWSNNDFGLHMQGCNKVLPIGRDRLKRLKQQL